MRVCYCTEHEVYNKTDLQTMICPEDDTVWESTLLGLRTRRILFEKDSNYFFEFVGVIILDTALLFVLPKYVCQTDKKKVAKQLLLLFNEYSKKENLEPEEIEGLGTFDGVQTYNELSAIMFLMEDYFANGLYTNDKSVYVLGGHNAIDWPKTMDEVEPFIDNGSPVYLEYYTLSDLNDEENFFLRLHRYVLTQCTERLQNIGLLDFLGFDPVSFDTDDYHLGPVESMLYRIEHELSIQFVTRKQILLRIMYIFLAKQQIAKADAVIRFYGTRTFHTVWEKTCAYVLDNRYEQYKKHIKKPSWTTMSGKIYPARTLKPDIITIVPGQETCFIISDAKYYNIALEDTKPLSGNPGVEDVTKQYLYQRAFSKYIAEENYDMTHSVFLFPTEDGLMRKLGVVTLDFMKSLNLEDIKLIALPAPWVFDMYIGGQRLDLVSFVNFLSPWQNIGVD